MILAIVVKTSGTTMCQYRSCVWRNLNMALKLAGYELTRSEWMLLKIITTTQNRYLLNESDYPIRCMLNSSVRRRGQDVCDVATAPEGISGQLKPSPRQIYLPISQGRNNTREEIRYRGRSLRLYRNCIVRFLQPLNLRMRTIYKVPMRR